MRASCVALKASFQHLCDLLKKRRENLAGNNNDQEQEHKLKLQQSTKGGGSVEAQLPLVESEKHNNPSPKPRPLKFHNEKNEFVQLSTPSPPSSSPVAPQKPPEVNTTMTASQPPNLPEKVTTSPRRYLHRGSLQIQIYTYHRIKSQLLGHRHHRDLHQETLIFFQCRHHRRNHRNRI
ncbi:hypothetical protein QL285_075867 [Trifolium repens]|nr:hypothetical protein QL285_075867 [Trifolium repens]